MIVNTFIDVQSLLFVLYEPLTHQAMHLLLQNSITNSFHLYFPGQHDIFQIILDHQSPL